MPTEKPSPGLRIIHVEKTVAAEIQLQKGAGGRQKPEMLSPSLLSLIRSFQTLLLMFVLCYILTREKKKWNAHGLQDILL